MKMRKWIIILTFLSSCVIPYDFTQDTFKRMLVVEGYVSDRPGEHRVYLSWSSDFEEREFEQEKSALVTVIENGTREIPFMYQEEGYYAIPDSGFAAVPGNQYSLKIEVNNHTYHSDEVEILPSADIDSLNFTHDVYYQSGEQVERKTLRLQVTTKEVPDASRYYRYIKEETWLTIATESRNRKITPRFILQDGVPIDVEWDVIDFENITYCWPTAEGRGISIATTEGLSSNKLIHQTVGGVNLYSDKLLYKYSALIRQFSIPKEAHHFLSLMKEFSEGEGTLFEVQPGFVEGNIRSVSHEDEKVIGIFYASAVKEARIFIRLVDLDLYYRSVVISHARSCENETVGLPIVDSIPDQHLTEKLLMLRDSMMAKRGLVISDVLFEGMPGTDVVYLSNNVCVDCRGRGTNVKPEWWGEIL